MVHRRVTGAVSLACLILIAALLVPALADASNRRLSISNYQWSSPEVNLDLGEHVTWYWTGPDTMHSVTGKTANAVQWDSDPGNLPQHNIGDEYQVTFDKPGIYHFQCKIHSLVGGTVVVSNNPGDPTSEPDPIPKSNVDLTKPVMRDVRLTSFRVGQRGPGPLTYSIAEGGKLDVEYYRYGRHGQKKFAGYATYKAHVGFNRARIGARKPHFKPIRGKYMVELRVTDDANNTSKVKRRDFHLW